LNHVCCCPGYCCFFSQLAPSSHAAAELLLVAEMVNQSVGDALSCILLVETALRQGVAWVHAIAQGHMTAWSMLDVDMSRTDA
jgi:hypothetical protein